MPIFMKVADDKGSLAIKGDVVAESHKEWVEIDSCSFGLELDEGVVRKSMQSPGGKKKGLKPTSGVFEVKKSSADRSGPQLMSWMVSEEEMKKVVIDVCGDTVGKGQWRKHVTYELSDVLLTKYSMNMSDAEKGKGSISMTLEYEKLVVSQYSYDSRNEQLKAKRSPSRPIIVEK